FTVPKPETKSNEFQGNGNEQRSSTDPQALARWKGNTVSIQAIVWVLEESPITKPSHVPVLLSLSNEADFDGKGAFPSQRTMAWQTRKTERAVRNDLEALKADGLIRPGDQARAAYIAADRRPMVWDLALELTRDMSKRPNP